MTICHKCGCESDIMNDRRPRFSRPANGWEFACGWYKEGDVERFIQSLKDTRSDHPDRIPEDIYSPEFAQWLTQEYRVAMAKGIQIGREWDKNK